LLVNYLYGILGGVESMMMLRAVSRVNVGCLTKLATASLGRHHNVTTRTMSSRLRIVFGSQTVIVVSTMFIMDQQ
jgi:hypothetical protein